MFYKNFLLIVTCILLSNCTTNLVNNKANKNVVNGYSNKGFALIFSESLYSQKIINKRIDGRSLVIFQKNLKIDTQVKVTNILNGKSLIGTVGKNSTYPAFYNAVLSKRIADELGLNQSQPYVQILEILENSMFVAKKAKTYDQEKNVAIKAPVNDISINDLSVFKKDDPQEPNIKFSYTIKVADFYFKDTAIMMQNRIITESLTKNTKIKKISDNKYRVYLGPFNNINSLQKSYNDISILEFENIEIIKND